MYTELTWNPKKLCAFEKSKPNNDAGWMPVIPFGPLVMLIGRSRLFMKIRMISPKPSVTMAR
ncbi:hypothetical protein PSP20601_05602 [Pandoraea sputorum]|nr:hypothetical protein PSP20601_05602 [Pandoraea sputorum]